MGRREERVFRLNDEIAAQRAQLDQAQYELGVHRHLDDDARRDAAVSGSPLDRADARETAADVSRLEEHVAALERSVEQLETRRARLLGKLG